MILVVPSTDHIVFFFTNYKTAAITARYLLKPKPAATRTLVCTGERMRGLIAKVYPDTRVTTFRPEHGNGLSNEFRCYASYESESGNWTYDGEEKDN